MAAGPRQVHTVLWWAATVLTLVLLDDLTFGPVFWVVSRVGSPSAGFLVALAVYVPAQIALVHRGTSDRPGRLATFMLSRLDLQRRSRQIAAREQDMRARVTGVASAFGLSLVIGGVLPVLLLHRAGYGTGFVRRLAVATSVAYAIEFALLHGLLPGHI
ncbi:MAG TPA: hypothetical protein VEW93_08710 [Acidimicrobiales bacterium]|nr:hypothetical protein [Acidimicrobiales bacterium]